MAPRVQLNDQQWRRVEAFIEIDRGVGRRSDDDRNFVEAVL